ncbi:hypothetical protein [Nigerium massiliense]|uniref:hypothetical protein n=1 Tax=Nigerium massiliense TaxID=1522317 RepID=UPI00058FF5DA|nr:hypothetical protein [Nigerium massiliense]
MARRPSKHLRSPRPLSASLGRSEVKSDGRWIIKNIPAERAEKRYLCPGCNRDIPVGVAHLVAWPDEPHIGSSTGLDDRRHWHNACWARRR